MDKPVLANSHTRSILGDSWTLIRIALGFLFLLGLGIRLYDLTDPPLDFHSTRQLRSAVIARGMYYENLDSAPAWQREFAVAEGKSRQIIEPPIVESIVAFTYRLIGSETLWVARIFSSLYWIIGGIALFLLARDMTSIDGGFAAVVFYLFLPFAAIASRSFQPDPFMVMWIVLAWWAFYRWYQAPSWKNALFAGILAGIALLVKNVALFMLLGGMGAIILVGRGLKEVLRDRQVWAIVGLSALPVILYTLYGIYALDLSGQFEGRFFPELLKSPEHYFDWFNYVAKLTSFSGLMIGLLGMFAFREAHQRAFVIGLWAGYGVYGLLFPYHFLTHNYYHLPVIPLVALSIAPVAALVFQGLAAMKPGRLVRIAIIGLVLLGIVFQLWDVRVTLAAEDFHHEPPYWEAVGEVVGHDTEVVAMTQDYGNRIAYYGWVTVKHWPGVGHFNYRELRGGKPIEFDEWFAEYIEGKDYFLVTRLKELDRQPELKETLYNNYEIYAQGDGYLVFDLKKPIP